MGLHLQTVSALDGLKCDISSHVLPTNLLLIASIILAFGQKDIGLLILLMESVFSLCPLSTVASRHAYKLYGTEQPSLQLKLISFSPEAL